MLEQALALPDGDAAEHQLRSAVQRARDTGDAHAQYRALDALALRRRQLDDNRVSLDLWLQAREAARLAGAPAGDRVRLDASVAFNLVSLGLADQAVEYAEAAYERALTLSGGTERVRAMNALALTQTRLGHYSQAQTTYRQAVREARLLPNALRELWRAYNNRGVCCSDEAQRSNASPARRAALLRRQLRFNSLAARVAAHDGETLYVLCNDTEALALLSRTDEAEAVFKRLQQMLAAQPPQATDARELSAVAMHLQGLIAMQRGRFASAAMLMMQGIAALEALEARDDLPSLLDRLSEAEEGRGHYREALAAVRRAARIRLELAQAQSEARLRMLEVRQGLQQARVFIEQERRRSQAMEVERRALQDEAQRLVEATRTDPLTGLGNRRLFDEAARGLAVDSDEPVGLAVLDLDHFKQVNDNHSHAVGDRVLVVVAELLRRTCRPEDVLVRLGGEEFAVVLRRMPPEAAQRACERLRHTIASHDWHALRQGLVITVSIGLVTAQTPVDAGTMLVRADVLLYDAKRAGRDRVCVHAQV